MMGAQLLSRDVRYPFACSALMSFINAVAIFFWLPESKKCHEAVATSSSEEKEGREKGCTRATQSEPDSLDPQSKLHAPDNNPVAGPESLQPDLLEFTR